MSSDPIAIHAKGLSKCYQLYKTPRDRLKQFVMPRASQLIGMRSRQYFREFWALKNVSFEVKRGETVGIVGRNGSGKSTLLQIICGTLTPTTGNVETRGRVAALLELGSGFNPEFSGRDNIYMNATLLGLSTAEIDQKYDSIAAFADIGDFLNQPVKTYSSGMMVRLAFAVQAQVEPDILIVDEALAVGDAKFQARCFERLKQLKENGTSILLVTHSSEQIVTHCSRALLLVDGAVMEVGEPRHVVNRYMDLLFGKELIFGANERFRQSESEPKEKVAHDEALSTDHDVFSTRPGYNPHEYRWGDGAARILDFHISVNDSSYPSSINAGENVRLALTVRFDSQLVRPILGITIKTKEGVTVYGFNSETMRLDSFRSVGDAGTVMRAEIDFSCRLASGDYFVSLGIATRHAGEVIPHDRRYDAIHIRIRPDDTFFGLVDLGAKLSATTVSS